MRVAQSMIGCSPTDCDLRRAAGPGKRTRRGAPRTSTRTVVGKPRPVNAHADAALRQRAEGNADESRQCALPPCAKCCSPVGSGQFGAGALVYDLKFGPAARRKLRHARGGRCGRARGTSHVLPEAARVTHLLAMPLAVGVRADLCHDPRIPPARELAHVMFVAACFSPASSLAELSLRATFDQPALHHAAKRNSASARPGKACPKG